MPLAVDASSVPFQSYSRLFLRFLRFGALAWGGPVAQIGMLKRELVDEERWITRERFNRVLAVYQVLPGPEAHELCVYFGTLARGRVGGLLAGLGFMLPGLVGMLLLSWLYVTSHGTLAEGWTRVFLALQAAVVALIVRAIHRIGSHALHDSRLLAIALAAFLGGLAGLHFAINLALAGVGYCALLGKRRGAWVAIGLAWLAAASAVFVWSEPRAQAETIALATSPPSTPELFCYGLRSGLLTFGGAYTVIPFLQRDAVVRGAWMTNDQFLDGLALSGILPAPLIIFGTFVGYVAGRLLGAMALTAGIFLPAFGFTLVAHDPLERLTDRKGVHRFLDGVTAGVVGLIAVTTLQLSSETLTSFSAVAVFGLSLALLYLVKHRLTVLLVMACAAGSGMLLF